MRPDPGPAWRPPRESQVEAEAREGPRGIPEAPLHAARAITSLQHGDPLREPAAARLETRELDAAAHEHARLVRAVPLRLGLPSRALALVQRPDDAPGHVVDAHRYPALLPGRDRLRQLRRTT